MVNIIYAIGVTGKQLPITVLATILPGLILYRIETKQEYMQGVISNVR